MPDCLPDHNMMQMPFHCSAQHFIHITQAHRTRRLSAASVSLLGRFGRMPIGYTLYGSSSGVAAARDSTSHDCSTTLPDGGVGTPCALCETVVESHKVRGAKRGGRQGRQNARSRAALQLSLARS